MAQTPAPAKTPAPNFIPKPVPVEVKVQPVTMVLVEYSDESNRKTVQLAMVGKNHVQLLNGQSLGLATGTQRSGNASVELRNAIFNSLGLPIPTKTEE